MKICYDTPVYFPVSTKLTRSVVMRMFSIFRLPYVGYGKDMAGMKKCYCGVIHHKEYRWHEYVLDLRHEAYQAAEENYGDKQERRVSQTTEPDSQRE